MRWLDNANDPGNDGGGGSDYPKDAFGMTLSYYANDFVRSGSPYEQSHSWSYAPTSLYNGNIAGWIHSARDINGTPTRALAELYGYDYLNRIVADTGVNRATGGTSWDSKPAGLGALGSAYTYDPNGNLKTVVRNDAGAQSVDNLTYTPVSSTVNLLDKVVDGTTAAASSYTNDLDETQANGNYAYDAIGNLTKDVAAGISTGGIQWTPYGKIRQITNATYRIEYLYDAMGNRVRQKRTKLSDNTYVTTYYGRDASGKNVIGTYEKIGTGSTVLKEVPLYGSSRIGILRPNATQSTTAITPPTIYTRSLGRKEYEITDHLGNVRVSVSDRLVKPGSDWLNDVKMQTDYFPYGMQREDRNDNVTGYRYGYNGQEHVDDIAGEGNHLTAKFWEYDPRIARRWNMDPKPTVGISDYATFANNPILFADPLGDTVWGYTESIDRSWNIGGLARHGFLRVKTEKRDVIIELWGQEETETARPTGRPRILEYQGSNDIWGRRDVEEFSVKRPKGKLGVGEVFENRILQLAEEFGRSTTTNGKSDYYSLPEYDATGPNSNGYVRSLILMAGGSTEMPFWAIGEGKTSIYEDKARYTFGLEWLKPSKQQISTRESGPSAASQATGPAELDKMILSSPTQQDNTKVVPR